MTSDPPTESSMGWPNPAYGETRALRNRIRALREENDLLRTMLATMGGEDALLAPAEPHPDREDLERTLLAIPLPQLRRWQIEAPHRAVIQMIEERNNVPTLLLRLRRPKREA